MSEAHYLDNLYPLQDEVLKILSEAKIKHYLTGGTVVSRCFFNHRYSDDLDFFLNWDGEFEKETDKAIETLKIHFSKAATDNKQEHYSRVYIDRNGLRLKIDFVNDVSLHVGAFQSSPLYYKIDNPFNILTNKISALSRRAAKDVADIIWICKKYTFNWPEMITLANQKDDWVNETDVHENFKTFPQRKLIDEVLWVKTPQADFLAQAISQICLDIANGSDNSLVERV